MTEALITSVLAKKVIWLPHSGECSLCSLHTFLTVLLDTVRSEKSQEKAWVKR
jgi:hypothetical protein